MTSQVQRHERRIAELSPNRPQENRLMKALHISAASAALAGALISPTASQGAVPVVERIGKGAQIKCGFSSTGATVVAAHADKIVFVLTGGLPAVDPADQAALNAIPRNTELDIKVLDNPKAVADLRGKVLSFIGAVDNGDTRLQLKILEVKYAMVCPSTTTGL